MKKIRIKYSELSQSEIVTKRIILSFGIKIEIFTSAIIRNSFRILIIKKTFFLEVVHAESLTIICMGVPDGFLSWVILWPP